MYVSTLLKRYLKTMLYQFSINGLFIYVKQIKHLLNQHFLVIDL
jgi:hypothetical protein